MEELGFTIPPLVIFAIIAAVTYGLTPSLCNHNLRNGERQRIAAILNPKIKLRLPAPPQNRIENARQR